MAESDGKGVGDHRPGEQPDRPVFGQPLKPRAKPRQHATPRRQPVDAGPHERPEFGVLPQKPPRETALSRQLARTIKPTGLAETLTKSKEKRPPLQEGGTFTVGPHLVRFNGVIGDIDTQPTGSFNNKEEMRIVKVHRTPKGYTLELAHEGPDASVSHEFVGKIGDEWQRTTPERVDQSDSL